MVYQKENKKKEYTKKSASLKIALKTYMIVFVWRGERYTWKFLPQFFQFLRLQFGFDMEADCCNVLLL